MKALFWVLAIAGAGVGLTLLAHYNTGYVLLVLPPYRVEFSFNLLLVGLLAAFIVGYLAVRLVSGTVRLPAQVREYRLARRRDQARASLLEALQEYFSGRYARSEKAAAVSLELGEHAGLSAVLAARAAHELRAYERRDRYLASAAAGDEVLRTVTEAELLLDERRFEEALERLKGLPRKHTAALRLELKARQQMRNWEQVLALADELQKRNVFDESQAAQVRRYALIENLKRKALDSRALEDAWRKVPQQERTDSRVAAAAARCFIALGGCDLAHRIIEDALAQEWDSDLVGLYAECEGGDALKRIERAESWLKSHADDALLLLTLGRLCARQALWGKAQSYLEASIAIEPTYSAHLALAQLREQLGNADAARRHFRESLELALVQLRATTGGRRRTSL